MNNNNYSLGIPAHDYNSLLVAMSSTSVHSSQTSSIPLAEFWHPDRNKNQKQLILNAMNISQRQYEEANKSFEYPTKAYKTGVEGTTIQHSGPSMTDLMIESNTIKITVEAKYTEYQKDACPYSPLIGEWKKTHEGNPNRLEILNCWRRYIGLDQYTSITESDKDNVFPYQFLHRSASACFNSTNKTKVLLYQLFYDTKTKEALAAFEDNLSKWAKELTLREKDVKFVIAEIEVMDESPALMSKEKGKLFIKMIEEPQYIFGSVICKDGYTLQCIR